MRIDKVAISLFILILLSLFTAACQSEQKAADVAVTVAPAQTAAASAATSVEPVETPKTEAAEPPAQKTGFITGKAHLMAPPTPPLIIYAVDTVTGKWISVETPETNGETPFTLEAPPGSYLVFAFPGGLGYSADGTALTPVVVNAGQTTLEITLAPPGPSDCGPMFGIPASPDGQFAAISGPAEDCAATEASAASPEMPNPASVFCQEQGGQLEIRAENGGQVGYCVFLDGSECEEWNFFNGPCLPASASVCGFLAGNLESKLGVEAAITAQTSFEDYDYINGQTGTGCQITASGTGLDFEDAGVLSDAVNGMFQEGGWQADLNYEADGPTGSMGGYRQGGALCLWATEWATSAEANCPSDQPISACQLTPEQTLYTAAINCLQDAAPIDNIAANDSTQPAERIQFSPGAISSQVQGSLQAGEWDEYVLNAMAGQEMIVRLYNPEITDAVLVIWGDDGTVLISDHAGADNWTGILPATQDYYIDVKSAGQEPVNYTMEVVIPPTTGASEGPEVLPLDTPVGFEILYGLADSLMLPPDFPVEAGQPAIAPYIITAEPGEYEVSLDYGSDCHGAGACHYGSLAGKKVTSDRPESSRNFIFEADRAQPVLLANNIQGYFIEAQCGANCDDAKIFWIYNGFQYMLGLKGASRSDVVELANAAIINSLGLSDAPAVPNFDLSIQSFTIDAEDNANGGKRLILNWQTTGASQAQIWHGSGYNAYRWDVEPAGTLTVDYNADEAYNAQNFTLIAIDNRGNTVDQSAGFQFPCRYTLFFDSDPNRCASHEAGNTAAAEQPFEYGRMIWLRELRYSPDHVIENAIVAIYDDGRWEKFDDPWQSGEPESDPAIVPPAGLYQPQRGFGKLWRDENYNLRERLGWGLTEEQGFETVWQDDTWLNSPSAGNDTIYIRAYDGQIIKLVGSGSGTWEVVKDY